MSQSLVNAEIGDSVTRMRIRVRSGIVRNSVYCYLLNNFVYVTTIQIEFFFIIPVIHY